MAGVDERQAFAKLEALKDIRTKTICLEKTRISLLCDVAQLEEEDRCLEEYRRELELLQQEKMAHVEELRQIHADINAMDTIIKQAEESRRLSQVKKFPHLFSSPILSPKISNSKFGTFQLLFSFLIVFIEIITQFDLILQDLKLNLNKMIE